MFMVNLAEVKEWCDLEKNRLLVETQELCEEHDLATFITDPTDPSGEEVIPCINIDAINNPDVAYKAGNLAGQRLVLNGLVQAINSMQKTTTPDDTVTQ